MRKSSMERLVFLHRSRDRRVQSAGSILFHGHELARPVKTLRTKSWARSCMLGLRSKLLRLCSRNRRYDQAVIFQNSPQLCFTHSVICLAVLLHIYSFCSFTFFCLNISQRCYPHVLPCAHLVHFVSLASESDPLWFRCIALYVRKLYVRQLLEDGEGGSVSR